MPSARELEPVGLVGPSSRNEFGPSGRSPSESERSDVEVVDSLGIGKDPIWRLVDSLEIGKDPMWRFVDSLEIGKDPMWRSSTASESEKIRCGGRRQPRNRKRSDFGVHHQREQCFRCSTTVSSSPERRSVQGSRLARNAERRAPSGSKRAANSTAMRPCSSRTSPHRASSCRVA